METVVFILMGALALVGAGFVVLHRNPVKSALALIVVMLALAVLYMTLSAPFIAVIQVMVYAGAVMVLFLFVLFLLNVGVESPFATRRSRRLIAGLVGTLMGLLLSGALLLRSSASMPQRGPDLAEGFGSIETAGELLFTRYLLPFELLSVLLLVAIVGAVVAARPRWPLARVPAELWPEGTGPSDDPPSGGEISGNDSSPVGPGG